MATLAQLRANRRNATKSTGPRTPAGKQRSALNATKHGLTATTTVLVHEDAEAFEQLRSALHDEIAPSNTVDWMKVEMLAHQWWRMLRNARLERGMLDSRLAYFAQHEQATDKSGDFDENLSAALHHFTRDIDLMRRYSVAVERAYYRALAEVEQLRKAQNPPDPPTARPQPLAVKKFHSIGFVSRTPRKPEPSSGATAVLTPTSLDTRPLQHAHVPQSVSGAWHNTAC